MHNIDKLKYYVPVFIVSAGILIVSHQSSIDNEVPLNLNDKILHIIAYLVFGLALIYGIHKNHYRISKQQFFLIFIISGALFALSDELHQYFIPGRDSDVFDWFADLIGLSFAYLIYKIYRLKIIRG